MKGAAMGKGFDVFMENPYWRRVYEEAPGEGLKEYYRTVFDSSPFVMEDEAVDEAADGRANRGDVMGDGHDEEAYLKLKELWISREELEYLKKHAGTAQAKAFYQKCIDILAEPGSGPCVSAACLTGEIRNPWYVPEGKERNR